MAVVAVVEQRGTYRADGHLSVRGWLRANTNCSRSEASAIRKRAEVCDRHPAVGAALADGHIGVGQVVELARVAANPRVRDQFVDAVDGLLTHAEQLSFDDFRTVVRRWEMLADLDGAAQDARDVHDARAASVVDVDGGLFARITGGDPLTTAAVIEIFERYVHAEFDADVAARTELHGPDAPVSLLPRTDAQRRFDAVVKIFLDAIATPAGERLPDPVVNVVVDWNTFQQALADHDLIAESARPGPTDLADLLVRRCETDIGIPVHPDTVVRAALIGHIRRVVMTSDSVVIDMGRTTRLFTGAARTAAKLMARRCTTRGCTIGVHRCQIDHLDEWDRDGGSTSSDNGAPRCGPHNRHKHRAGITTTRDGHGNLVDHRPDGTPILPVGQRHRPRTRRDDHAGERPGANAPEPHALVEACAARGYRARIVPWPTAA